MNVKHKLHLRQWPSFFFPHTVQSPFIDWEWIWLSANSPLAQRINCGQTADFYCNVKKKKRGGGIDLVPCFVVILMARCCFWGQVERHRWELWPVRTLGVTLVTLKAARCRQDVMPGAGEKSRLWKRRLADASVRMRRFLCECAICAAQSDELLHPHTVLSLPDMTLSSLCVTSAHIKSLNTT